jgi:hypothetical protein
MDIYYKYLKYKSKLVKKQIEIEKEKEKENLEFETLFNEFFDAIQKNNIVEFNKLLKIIIDKNYYVKEIKKEDRSNLIQIGFFKMLDALVLSSQVGNKDMILTLLDNGLLLVSIKLYIS